MIVTYETNNSGGSWWLSDSDWQALEDAGWTVHWGRREYDPDKLLTPREKKGERWLGALACSAAKEFDSLADAAAEFERVAGQDLSDEGCNCCGPPHSLSADNGQSVELVRNTRWEIS